MTISQLISFVILARSISAQNTVSLFKWPEYQVLRTCAQACIWGSSGSVADTIGCPAPWYDSCVCDSHQQASAASHVSSCVQSLCTVGSKVDAPTAVAAYTDYCYSAGFTTAGQASPTTSLDLKTVSLFQDSGYKTLRTCAQACIWGYQGSVGDFIGCPAPWYNTCVCNVDQQPAALKNVGNCVTTQCTGTQDVATAMKVYTDYCSGAGYQLAGAAVKTTGSGGALAGTTPVVTGSLPGGTTSLPTNGGGDTPVGTSTQPSATSPPDSKSPLSTGGIIGVAISGACSVLGLIFGIGFKIWKHKKQQKKDLAAGTIR